MLIDDRGNRSAQQALAQEQALLSAGNTSALGTVAIDTGGSVRITYSYPRASNVGKLVMAGAMAVALISLCLELMGIRPAAQRPQQPPQPPQMNG